MSGSVAEVDGKARELAHEIASLEIEKLHSMRLEETQTLFFSLRSQLSSLARQLAILSSDLPVYDLNRYQRVLDSLDLDIENLRKELVCTERFRFAPWTIDEILEETFGHVCQSSPLVALPEPMQSLEPANSLPTESVERFGFSYSFSNVFFKILRDNCDSSSSRRIDGTSFPRHFVFVFESMCCLVVETCFCCSTQESH
jgi:hypothetical protein